MQPHIKSVEAFFRVNQDRQAIANPAGPYLHYPDLANAG